MKHEVTDEYAVEKTHPVFYNLAEQWQGFTEYLQDLPPRHFVLKMRGQKVRVGKTRHLPKPRVDPKEQPRVDPKELADVEQEYLRRYFHSKQEIAGETRGVQEIRQSATLFQPINRRERLR